MPVSVTPRTWTRTLPIVLIVWLGMKAIRYLKADKSDKPAYDQ